MTEGCETVAVVIDARSKPTLDNGFYTQTGSLSSSTA